MSISNRSKYISHGMDRGYGDFLRFKEYAIGIERSGSNATVILYKVYDKFFRDPPPPDEDHGGDAE